MLHNDNKNDQLFRDRLQDHSSPVRADLWRRIYNGLGSRPAFRLPFRAVLQSPFRAVLQSPFRTVLQSPIRYWPFLAAGTAAAATLAITVTYFIHNPAKRPHPTTNSTASVTHPSPATPPTATPLPATAAPATVQPVNHYLTISPAHPTFAPPPLRPPTLIAANSPQFNTSRRQTSLDLNSATHPGSTPTTHPSSTPATHHPNPVTLPAIARTTTRIAIPTHPFTLKSRHNGPGDPINPPGDRRFLKSMYISLYGGPELVTNHYYGPSSIGGVRLTLKFSRHWSFITGLEYSKVEVPTQVVPPILPFDTLHAFYFSNIEVPVLFGYTRTFGRSALTVNAGAILNLRYRHSNSPGNQVTSSTSTWVFNWPDRDSYGAVLGVDYSYLVGRSLAVFTQPYERYSISNYRMFIPQQRPSTGILLGIRYQL